MNPRTKKTIKRTIGLTLFALIALALAVLPMLASAGMPEPVKASVLTAQVEVADLNRNLLGGGALNVPDPEPITVPAGVVIRELLVNGSDRVKQGDTLATVDRVSVMTAVTQVQEALDTITGKLQTAANGLHFGAVTVDEEGTVYAGGRKLSGDELEKLADYYKLSQQRRDYEALLLELFRIYQTGTVTAAVSGMVDGLDKTLVHPLGYDGGAQLQWLATNTPNGAEDDGITYLGFVGVVNSISIETGSWNMLMNPIPTSLTDLADTSAVNRSVTAMTQEGVHEPHPVFAWDGTEWQNVENLQSGDILLFVYSDSLEWILKLGSTTDQPEGGGRPDGGMQLPEGLDIGSILGGMGGYGGYSAPSREPELYSLDTVTLCRILPTQELALTISVDEQDISELHTGMEAAICLDALPGQQFTAQITDIALTGTNNGGSTKFAVTLTLPWDADMLPGMNASAQLTLETQAQVPTLPVAALYDIGGQTLVYTGYDEKTETLLDPIAVETGLSDGVNVRILSGLPEGTTVWYRYYDVLEISAAAESNNPFG